MSHTDYSDTDCKLDCSSDEPRTRAAVRQNGESHVVQSHSKQNRADTEAERSTVAPVQPEIGRKGSRQRSRRESTVHDRHATTKLSESKQSQK